MKKALILLTLFTLINGATFLSHAPIEKSTRLTTLDNGIGGS
ncbi:hypothetical protein ACE3MZ_21415 [Paenibacillus sp. WLX1005]